MGTSLRKAKISRERAEAREAELAQLTQALQTATHGIDALMLSDSPSSEGALTPEPEALTPAGDDDDDLAAIDEEAGASLTKKRRKKRRRQS